MTKDDILASQNNLSFTPSVFIKASEMVNHPIMPVDIEKELPDLPAEIDRSKLYMDTSGSPFTMIHLYYWDDEKAVLFGFPMLNVPYIIDSITKARDMAAKAFDEGKWAQLISFCPDEYRLLYFERYRDRIPKDLLFDLFIEVYTNRDYGAAGLSMDTVRMTAATRTKCHRDDTIARLSGYPDTMTIYRGEGSASLSADRAYSWTTDINTAIFFAVKNGYGPSQVLRASVSKQDVIAYVTDRSESEIIVLSENVRDVVTEIGMASPNDTGILNDILPYYRQYRSQLLALFERIRPGSSSDAHEVHGILHMARVLFLALAIAREYPELFDNESLMDLLCTACITHDIGRTNDDEDDNHGAASFRVVEDDFYFAASSRLEFLLKYHCLPDSEAEKSPVYADENMALLYKILKDADALDRVRFGVRGLDVNYLRLPASRTLVLLARVATEQLKV